jgi:hypothetical protein
MANIKVFTDENEFKNALKYIYTEFGADNFNKGNALIDNFAKVAPDMKRKQKLVKMVVQSGIRDNFINVPEAKRQDAISKSMETLQEDFFLDESIARDLLESIAFAYGWEIKTDDVGGADSGEKALICQLIQKAANIGKLCDNIAFAAQSGIGKSEITKEINDALVRLMSKADNIDKIFGFYGC